MKRLMALLILLAAGAVAAAEYPDIRRYLKIRAM
jgi:hypothetical protein